MYLLGYGSVPIVATLSTNFRSKRKSRLLLRDEGGFLTKHRAAHVCAKTPKHASIATLYTKVDHEDGEATIAGRPTSMTPVVYAYRSVSASHGSCDEMRAASSAGIPSAMRLSHEAFRSSAIFRPKTESQSRNASMSFVSITFSPAPGCPRRGSDSE